MPRRNRNVRERNTPRQAQRQPKGTERTQPEARADRRFTKQPSPQYHTDAEYGLYMGEMPSLPQP